MSTLKRHPKLPPQFAELEPFVADWALASETERYDKRERSSFEEIRRFYDAMLPRAKAALDYLDSLSLNDMPEDAKRLIRLLFSLATVSFAVEVWKQPRAAESGTAKILSVFEPQPI